MARRTKKRFSRFLKTPKILLGVAVLLVGLIVLLEATNTTHLFHRQSVNIESAANKASVTSNKGEVAISPSTSPSSSSSSAKEQNSPTSSVSSGAAPKAPFGNFVSSHTIT